MSYFFKIAQQPLIDFKLLLLLWTVNVHDSLHVKMLDFAPFVIRTDGIRLFFKSNFHAHDLHVKMLDFAPFTIRTWNNSNCL